MKYRDLIESIADSLLEDDRFWSDVNKELAVGLSLDPNHIGLENTVGKEWAVTHNKDAGTKKGIGRFPVVLGKGRTLQHAFSDALGRIPRTRPAAPPKTQGNLFDV